jgi:hypothetical protein
MLARKQHHCRGPDTAAPCPTGMPPRSAAPATPPSTMAHDKKRKQAPERQVGTTQRSIAAMASAWLRRNVRHVCDGGPRCLIMYLETDPGGYRLLPTGRHIHRFVAASQPGSDLSIGRGQLFWHWRIYERGRTAPYCGHWCGRGHARSSGGPSDRR